MRCVFRETPPLRLQAELLDPREAANAILESFYGATDVEVIALYPSLDDLLELLSVLHDGLRPLTPLPLRLRRYAGSKGGAWLAANPAPDGSTLDCNSACSYEPLIVYEGGRVYYPAASLAGCRCRVHSIASLEDYGIASSLAWATGLEGGLRHARLPAARREDLARAAGAARRMRTRSIAALNALKPPERIGVYAAFYRDPPLPSTVPADELGLHGYHAVSLFMEPGCYARGARVGREEPHAERGGGD